MSQQLKQAEACTAPLWHASGIQFKSDDLDRFKPLLKEHS
jgi:hypothetical protein